MPITVVLADDNVIVREGVRALLSLDAEIEVVGVAGDYDELVTCAIETSPQVVVTDIRMPPSFQNEGIEAAKEIRRRLPGTAAIILSQFDDPEYAISLLEDGAAGYGYLLKDRVADGNRLTEAIRDVATGGSALDPQIVSALVNPVRVEGALNVEEEALLLEVAEGRPVKAIAASRNLPPAAIDDAIKKLFLTLAKGASAGQADALKRLRQLHGAILEREEQGETLSRLLPSGLARKLRMDKGAADRTERLTVTVLMSDVRGYSGIAEHSDPAQLARQLNDHRRAMNEAILGEGGTVMQYVGDAVMAVFGAPEPLAEHAATAIRAATAMHHRQAEINAGWAAEDSRLQPFGLGIGLSTGEVAAALLGSEERLEYTLVGDTVNLSQRLESIARPAGTTVASKATLDAAGTGPAVGWEPLGAQDIKGREGTIEAFALHTEPPANPNLRRTSPAGQRKEGHDE